MTSVICKHCDRQIGSPAGLTAHIKSMHPGVRAPLSPEHRGSLPPPSPSSGEMAWEDPPPKYLGKAAQAVLAAVALFPQLRRNPGRWARICEFKTQSTAFGQVKKLRESHPDIEFEARGRETGSAIWARYVEEA